MSAASDRLKAMSEAVAARRGEQPAPPAPPKFDPSTASSLDRLREGVRLRALSPEEREAEASRAVEDAQLAQSEVQLQAALDAVKLERQRRIGAAQAAEAQRRMAGGA
ncbi:MAG: hypothetical protein U0167_15475 [bacterium]